MERPGFSTGFARGPGESAYPGLWNGLVGLWAPSAGVQGITTLRDFSPYQNHGTLGGGMTISDWTAGERGYALNYDGSNDQVQVTNNAAFNFTAAGLTVATWFNCDTHAVDDNNYIVSKPNTVSTIQWALLQRDFGSATPQGMVFAIETSVSGLVAFGPDDSNFYTDQKWHHLAGTYDGATARLYVDGVQAASSAVTGTIVNTGNNNLFVGTYNATTTTGPARFDGRIGDTSVYNRPLSPGEVTQLYLGASPLTPGRPVFRGSAVAAATSLSASVNDSASAAESVTVTNTGLGGASVNDAVAVAENVNPTLVDNIALNADLRGIRIYTP